MAEVLGVVASGVGVAAFAVQIGANVQRLVVLWKSIRNAPQHIHDLLVEIEVLAEVLADFEAAQPAGHSVAHTPPSRRALQLCKHVAEDLRIVLDKFEAVLGHSSTKGVRQRTWTAVKATFKEGEIKELLQRLERAKMTLVLAGNCSSIAQMAAFRLDQSGEIENLRILITGLTDESRASATRDPPKTAAIRHSSTTGPVRDVAIKSQLVRRSYWTPFGSVQYRSSSKQKLAEDIPSGGYSSWTYWPSSWTFLKHGLEVLGDRSLGRPQFVFRTFRILPGADDPAYLAVANGELQELKRLCALGHASPFDRTGAGLSLLHAAVIFYQPDICSWLIERGVSVDETIRGNCLSSPLALMAHMDFISRHVKSTDPVFLIPTEPLLNHPQSESTSPFLIMANILLDATELDTTLIKLATAVAEHPSLTAYMRVERYAKQGNIFDNMFKTWSICQGLSVILRPFLTDFESLNEHDSTQSHRTCVLREFLNFGLCYLASQTRANLDFHKEIAKFLFLNLHGHHLLHERPKYDEEKECCHSRWSQETPLLWLFFGLLILKNRHFPIDHALTHVKRWLSALRMAGVDLFAYLKTEEKTNVRIVPIKRQELVYFRLRFKFGERDEDHRVWANYMIIKLPQQSAEDLEVLVPGGWKEDNFLDNIEPTGTIGLPFDIDSEDGARAILSEARLEWIRKKLTVMLETMISSLNSEILQSLESFCEKE